MNQYSGSLNDFTPKRFSENPLLNSQCMLLIQEISKATMLQDYKISRKESHHEAVK